VKFVGSADSLVAPFQGSMTPAGKVIGHFTQVVWASMYRVGCARIWNPENTFGAFKYALICNYTAPTDPGMEISAGKGSERLVPSQIISLCALVALWYFW
jgi:hypothetical protein